MASVAARYVPSWAGLLDSGSRAMVSGPTDELVVH